MKLKTKILVTEDYKGGSGMIFFTNIKAGEEIEVSIDFDAQRSSYKPRPSLVKLTKLSNQSVFECSVNRAKNYLKSLKHVEI